MTNKERQDAIAALLAGKLYLEEFGWRQEAFGGFDQSTGRCGPACVMGALMPRRAWDLVPAEYSPYAMQAIESEVLNIPSWNDDPKRTKAQVLAAFDRAIARLEADE